MKDLKLLLVSEEDLTEDQKDQIDALGKECFSDIPQEEKTKDFIAESFGRILAYDPNGLIGMLRLFNRQIEFDNDTVALGGLGGVCVKPEMRGFGVGSKMVKKGLEVLHQQKCDVAILNVDRKKEAYKLYEKYGFKFLNRDISFENADGRICYDGDSMLITINSPDKYNKIMESKTILHQGRGYW